MPQNITDETLEILHREYNKAAAAANSLQEIIANLYGNLREISHTIPPIDSDVFWEFMDGLHNCLAERQMTFEITDFVTDLNSVLMYIIRWLNETRDAGIDINWYARRKALESDLTKILNKSVFFEGTSVSIRDRFGVRGILLNKESPEERIQMIKTIYKAVADILTKECDRKERFKSWYRNNPRIHVMARRKLDDFMTIPFEISSVKDYISSPKANGYKSLHFALRTTVYSDVLPGICMEIQLRDWHMHNLAEGRVPADLDGIPDQSHENYKNAIDSAISQVFVIDDCSKLHLPGFVSYDSAYDDRDGIRYPKHFADRRSK